MTINQIRTALATNLATVSGLRTAAVVPDNPNPPVAIVQLQSINYDGAFGKGLSTYEFLVSVLVGRADERHAQRLLDTYCEPSGATSIKAAIESDKSLGGSAFDVRVSELRNIGAVLLGEATYLTADFVVTVYSN